MAHAASQLKKKADLELTAAEEEKDKKRRTRKRSREGKKKVRPGQDGTQPGGEGMDISLCSYGSFRQELTHGRSNRQ